MSATVTQTETEVAWFQPVIKHLEPDTLQFFREYVGLINEEEVLSHIYHIRDRAWKILPYPCIGLFRFLDFSIHLSPSYPAIVQRVREGQTLLDLGCCFGQDLRKLAHDSGVSENLIGMDREGRFPDMGYDLFRDRAGFRGTFIRGDVFDETLLVKYVGHVDMIHMASFLHLFQEDQQRRIVRQAVKLLRGKGSMIFGRHLGVEENGGPYRMESLGWDLYRHDSKTIKNLFSGEGVKFEVESSLKAYKSVHWDSEARKGWQGNDTRQMMFTAVRTD